MAIVHGGLAAAASSTSAWVFGISGLLALAALALLVIGVAVMGGAVTLTPQRRTAWLLAAAVTGAVGAASYLLLGLTVPGSAPGGWAYPWSFGTLLVDTVVVRVAVFALRRTARATPERSR
jgi:hypothetical protein